VQKFVVDKNGILTVQAFDKKNKAKSNKECKIDSVKGRFSDKQLNKMKEDALLMRKDDEAKVQAKMAANHLEMVCNKIRDHKE